MASSISASSVVSDEALSASEIKQPKINTKPENKTKQPPKTQQHFFKWNIFLLLSSVGKAFKEVDSQAVILHNAELKDKVFSEIFF